MSKKLTIEQKAKRYEWFENALLELLDNRIEDRLFDEQLMSDEEKTPIHQIVEEWYDKVDYHADLINDKMKFLFDRICDENFNNFCSIKGITYNGLNKVYDEFLKEIGDKE